MPFSTVSIWRNQWGSGGDWGNQSCWKYGVQQWRTELPVRHSHTGPYWRIWVCVWGGQGNKHLYWDLWHWHCCPLVWQPHLSLVFLIILLIPVTFCWAFSAFTRFKNILTQRTPTSTPLSGSHSLSSHYHAKSSIISNQVLPIASSPPCRLHLYMLCQIYLFLHPLSSCVFLFGSQLTPQLQKRLQTTARVCACETVWWWNE